MYAYSRSTSYHGSIFAVLTTNVVVSYTTVIRICSWLLHSMTRRLYPYLFATQMRLSHLQRRRHHGSSSSSTASLVVLLCILLLQCAYKLIRRPCWRYDYAHTMRWRARLRLLFCVCAHKAGSIMSSILHVRIQATRGFSAYVLHQPTEECFRVLFVCPQRLCVTVCAYIRAQGCNRSDTTCVCVCVCWGIVRATTIRLYVTMRNQSRTCSRGPPF